MHEAVAVKKKASSSVHIGRAPGFLVNVFAVPLLLAEWNRICGTKYLEYEKP